LRKKTVFKLSFFVTEKTKVTYKSRKVFIFYLFIDF